MLLDLLSPEFVVPFMAFSIPIVAIIGGIAAGIVRMIGQQRLVELAQRERIAAIERGIDPAQLPPLPTASGDLASMFWSPRDVAKRRAQGLLIGGIVTIAAGVSILVFLRIIQPNDSAWAVGIIPITVGAALLLSSWLVRSQD